jgi:hypothetical protein
MHQQAQAIGENLVTGATTKTATKQQRKVKRELQAKLLKRAEAEKKKKLKNKLKNEKRKQKLKNRMKEEVPHPSARPPLPQVKNRKTLQIETVNEDSDDGEESGEPGDLRDQLRSTQFLAEGNGLVRTNKIGISTSRIAIIRVNYQ